MSFLPTAICQAHRYICRNEIKMSQTNETQIRELIKNWSDAVKKKDINSILAHHTNDMLLFDVIEPVQRKGIDEYKKSWEDDFFPWHSEDSRFEVAELEVFAGDDIAFCHGILLCNGLEKGQKVNLDIRLTVGLRKIAGEWMIAHEHHSEAVKL